jgi:hypothetical protein
VTGRSGACCGNRAVSAPYYHSRGRRMWLSREPAAVLAIDVIGGCGDARRRPDLGDRSLGWSHSSQKESRVLTGTPARPAPCLGHRIVTGNFGIAVLCSYPRGGRWKQRKASRTNMTPSPCAEAVSSRAVSACRRFCLSHRNCALCPSRRLGSIDSPQSR